MNRIFLVAFFATIVPFNLISAEPSAFGAGNLNHSQPYGLTSSEKVILQNKQNLKKVVVKSNNQANEVESLRERLDGLQSIIEGLSRKSRENRLDLESLTQKNSDELESSNEYEKRLGELSQANSQEIIELKLLTNEVSILLNSVNENYVSRNDFNVLVSDFNNFKDLVVKELKKTTVIKQSKSKKRSNGDIATSAKRNYDKKRYTESIEQYTYLIGQNYKPARAHYMIGEMNYYRKNYSDAIAYFKKSAKLYSKASYMPTLMLHTAISMDKTGDKKNAISFYRGVIAKYPDSKASEIAQTNLSNI
ncbi:MAG: tetratricopeptide repeat protein [Campylobacterota bacterium]|nr:tetratricopeptide repeat protein [Campylobacterota bacterium]